MKLLGRYLSPYVRRVAVSMNLMGTAYEHEPVPVFDEPDRIRAHNPLVRIPTLVLDDGEALVESWAILDWLDEEAGPAKRLTPAGGPERRRVMKLTAVGVGTIDKGVMAAYEGRFHPKEKVHQPWIDHNDAQVLGGLGFLDQAAAAAGGGWLAGGERPSQADVTAAVCFTFLKWARPKLEIEQPFPSLAAHAARCEELTAFRSAKP